MRCSRWAWVAPVVVATTGCGRPIQPPARAPAISPSTSGGDAVDLATSPVLAYTAQLCTTVAELDARYPCSASASHPSFETAPTEETCWPRIREAPTASAAGPRTNAPPPSTSPAAVANFDELLGFCRTGTALTTFSSAAQLSDVERTFRAWERRVREAEAIRVPDGDVDAGSTTVAELRDGSVVRYLYLDRLPRLPPSALETPPGSGETRGLLTGSIDDLAVGLTQALEERARAEIEMWVADSLEPMLCDGPVGLPDAPRHFLRNTCRLLASYGAEEGERPHAISWATLRDALENDVRRLPEALATSEVLGSGELATATRIALLLVAELRESTDPIVLIGRLAERLDDTPGIDGRVRVAISFVRVMVSLVAGPSVPEPALLGVAMTLFHTHLHRYQAEAQELVTELSRSSALAWNVVPTCPDESCAQTTVEGVLGQREELRELLGLAERSVDALDLCSRNSASGDCALRAAYQDLRDGLMLRLARIDAARALLEGGCARLTDEGDGSTEAWRAALALLEYGRVGADQSTECRWEPALAPTSLHALVAPPMLAGDISPGFSGNLRAALRELRATLEAISAARSVLSRAETDAPLRDAQTALLLGHYVRALELAVRFITEDEDFAVPHALPTLLRAIASGEAGAMVAATIDLLAEVVPSVTGGLDATSLRALTFAGQIVRADSSEEVRDAVTAFAAPVGSYRSKRFDPAPRLYLNGLVGFMAGGELYLGRLDPDQLAANGALGGHVSLGLELNFGGWEDVGSFGVYAAVIDVTPFASFVPDAAVRSDQVDPLSLLSPGAYLWWGVADTPFVVAAGVSFVPRGRALSWPAVAGDELSSRVDVVRFQVILGADVTLLPF